MNFPSVSDLSISILGTLPFSKSIIPSRKVVSGDMYTSLFHWFLISLYLFGPKCVSCKIEKLAPESWQNFSAVSNLSLVFNPPVLREIML